MRQYLRLMIKRRLNELKKKKVVELQQIAKDYGIKKKFLEMCKARLIVVLSNVPEIIDEMRKRIILNESIPVISDKDIKQTNTEPTTNLTQSPNRKKYYKITTHTRY